MYGSFSPLFKGTRYLPLLHLGEGSSASIEQIAEVVRSTESHLLRSDIEALLGSTNWRPHLVASVAVMLSSEPEHHLPSVWRLIDAWSWVVPQMIVVAFVADVDFVAKARQRFEDPCAISAKGLAALLGLAATVPALSAEVEQILARADVVAHLAQNVDGGDALCLKWRARLRELLTARGLRWEPRGQS